MHIAQEMRNFYMEELYALNLVFMHTSVHGALINVTVRFTHTASILEE